MIIVDVYAFIGLFGFGVVFLGCGWYWHDACCWVWCILTGIYCHFWVVLVFVWFVFNLFVLLIWCPLGCFILQALIHCFIFVFVWVVYCLMMCLFVFYGFVMFWYRDAYTSLWLKLLWACFCYCEFVWCLVVCEVFVLLLARLVFIGVYVSFWCFCLRVLTFDLLMLWLALVWELLGGWLLYFVLWWKRFVVYCLFIVVCVIVIDWLTFYIVLFNSKLDFIFLVCIDLLLPLMSCLRVVASWLILAFVACCLTLVICDF